MFWATLDNFCDTGSEVLGRGVANREFLRALLQADPFEEYHFFLGDGFDERQFREGHSWIFDRPDLAGRVKLLRRRDLPEALARHAYRAIHQSDPVTYYPGLLGVRARYAREATPLTAVTHSLSYPRFMAAFLHLLLAPSRPGDALVATSAAGAEALKRAFASLNESLAPRLKEPLIFQGAIRCIPLGVEISRFRPGDRLRARERLRLPGEGSLLLVLGRFSEYSKMDLLPVLELFRRLLRSHPDLRLCLAGATEASNYPENLRKQAEDRGVAARVLFLPDVEESEKPELYRAADLFLSLSDNPQETFGLTVIEAMASGLPVVGSDWDGYRDLIREGETGFRIPTRWHPDPMVSDLAAISFERTCHLELAQTAAVDLEVAEAACRRLLDHPEVRETMGRAARRAAETTYAWPVVIRQYLDLWKELKVTPPASNPPSPPFAKGGMGEIKRLIPHPFLNSDPLRMDYGRLFGHFATELLGPEDRVALSARGEAVSQRKDSEGVYQETEGYLDGETIRRLLYLLRRTGAGTVRQLAERSGAETDVVLRHVAWMLKRGLLQCGMRPSPFSSLLGSPPSLSPPPLEGGGTRREGRFEGRGVEVRGRSEAKCGIEDKGSNTGEVREAREQVLVMQLARMGDLIQSGPLLETLKDRGHRVSLLVDARCEETARGLPGVDEVVPLDLAGWSRMLKGREIPWPALYRRLAATLEPLRQRRSRVINLNHALLAVRLARYLGGEGVEGFGPGPEGGVRATGWSGYLVIAAARRRWNRVHLVDIFRGFSGGMPGVPGPSPRSPTWRITREDRMWAPEFLKTHRIGASAPLAAVHPGAGHPKRRWPAEYFAALCRQLQEAHPEVRLLLLGGPEEAALAGEIAERSGGNALNAAGRTTVGQMAALLGHSRVLVAGNTGPLHLAAAVGTPVVGLFFGPAFCFETGPYGEGHWVLQAEPECAPCPDDLPCPDQACGRQIPVEAVARLVSHRLSANSLQLFSLKTPPGVSLYASSLDHGGVVYRRVPPADDPREALAQALRGALLGLALSPIERSSDEPHPEEGMARLLRISKGEGVLPQYLITLLEQGIQRVPGFAHRLGEWLFALERQKPNGSGCQDLVADLETLAGMLQPLVRGEGVLCAGV